MMEKVLMHWSFYDFLNLLPPGRGYFCQYENFPGLLPSSFGRREQREVRDLLEVFTPF